MVSRAAVASSAATALLGESQAPGVASGRLPLASGRVRSESHALSFNSE